jgi:hypothetical protein
MSYVLPTILDLMEYANDAAAQAAFVTNASGGYGSNFLTGGTATADTYYGANTPDKAADGNESTYWQAYAGDPHWWEYDLGIGITKIARKFRVLPYWDGTQHFINFTIQGSNDNSNWDTLYSGSATTGSGWQEFIFGNSTAYRYYRVNGITGGNNIVVYEFNLEEMLTPALQDYSEATIKQEGSYSLKGMAAITDSLNKTLTRTVSPVINLTDKTIIKFDIRASRTGSNIKIGIHDSGATTSEITPTIVAADTWQTVVWDISAVSNANKDAIDSIIITIVNADAANTFYIDNMFADVIQNYLIHRGRDRFRTAGYSLGN